MDPVAYLATLSGSPETFHDIHTPLIAAAAAATPSWTPEQTNAVVTLVFGDLNATSLSKGQVLQLSLFVRDQWRPYPLHIPNRHDPTSSRTTVLLDYLAGNSDSVANLRRPYSVVPFSLDTSGTPAPPPPPAASVPSTPLGALVALSPSPPRPRRPRPRFFLAPHRPGTASRPALPHPYPSPRRPPTPSPHGRRPLGHPVLHACQPVRRGRRRVPLSRHRQVPRHLQRHRRPLIPPRRLRALCPPPI